MEREGEREGERENERARERERESERERERERERASLAVETYRVPYRSVCAMSVTLQVLPSGNSLIWLVQVYQQPHTTMPESLARREKTNKKKKLGLEGLRYGAVEDRQGCCGTKVR